MSAGGDSRRADERSGRRGWLGLAEPRLDDEATARYVEAQQGLFSARRRSYRDERNADRAG